MMGGGCWPQEHRWMQSFKGNTNPLSLELDGNLKMSKLTARLLPLLHYLLNLFNLVTVIVSLSHISGLAATGALMLQLSLVPH